MVSNRNQKNNKFQLGRHTAIGVFLIVAILLVYSQMRSFEFINFDDPLFVKNNHYVQQGLTLKTAIWSFTDATWSTNYWVPLTWLSILLDYQLYGMNAGGFHLTNMFFHILNTLLLFLALDRMTGRIWRSAFTAALFALHPLHVESVAWVTERKDMLSTFFWMLTLLSYVRYTKRPGASRYVLLFLCMLFGLMSKPMLVTLPFVLLLLDLWPLARVRTDVADGLQRSIFWRLGREKIPLFILITGVSVMAFLTQQAGGAVKSLTVYPMTVRLANALVAYIKYMGKMFWPVKLSFLYPHPGALPLWQVFAAAGLLALITFVAAKTIKQYPYIMVGWLWYLGTLVPVIGIVVIGPHAMADRYTYIPLVGLFMIIAWGIPDIFEKWRYKMMFLPILATGTLLALSVVSWFQVGHWQNNMTLYRHAIEVKRDNLTAYLNLGAALQEADRLDLAEKYYAEMIQINPEDPSAYNNLGFMAAQKGQMKDAIRYYRTALAKDPQNVFAYNNLGIALSGIGKENDAIARFSEVLRIDPSYMKAYTNMGNVFFKQGRYGKARECFLKVIENDPYDAKAHNDLGSALAKLGRLEEAIAHFREALRIKPDFQIARNNLKASVSSKKRIEAEITRPENHLAETPK
ncbi:tetratricopeptide repeat protein [Thermodesulfobacteriota bacterium]